MNQTDTYYLCNGCGAIAPERNQTPLRVPVRVVDPRSGEEVEAVYILCGHCQTKIQKGQAIRPGS